MKILVFLSLGILLSQCAIYEASSSADVDFFIQDNPEKRQALLFYNSRDDSNPLIGNDIASVESIYKRTGETGKSTEPFVTNLDDRVDLMRIDVANPGNSRIVQDFRIGHTPFISLMENQAPILEEVVDRDTYSHIREEYQESSSGSNFYSSPIYDQPPRQDDQGSYSFSGNSQNDDPVVPPQTAPQDYEASQASIEAAEKAQKAAEDARISAEQALESLQEARRTIEKQNHLDRLQREAEDAKREAEAAAKELQKAKDEIAKHMQGDIPLETPSNTTSPTTSPTSPPQEINVPEGYKVEYIPVLKPVDQKPVPTQSPPIILPGPPSPEAIMPNRSLRAPNKPNLILKSHIKPYQCNSTILI